MICPRDEHVKNFILRSKERLDIILERLGWSEDTTLKNFNNNSLTSSPKTAQKEPQRKATYPESCVTPNSLVLETSELKEILQNNTVQAPCNFEELQANFSREQKLKIYEHVIKNTKKLKNNVVEQLAEGEISLADILSQKKREEKRKKRRFRKSKPTHIEEVRCLVDLQMQALQQFMGNKANENSINSGMKTLQDCSLKEEDNRRAKIKHQDYYNRKEQKRKRRRSCSKEYDRDSNKRNERSIKNEVRSRSRQGGRRSRSSSKEFGYEKIRRRGGSSTRRKKRKSRSKQRCSRSKSRERTKHGDYSEEGSTKNAHKDTSKHKQNPRLNGSYERSTQQETNHDMKYHTERKDEHSYKYSRQSCNKEKHSRKEITSLDSKSGSHRKLQYGTENDDSEYKGFHQNSTKTAASPEKHKYGDKSSSYSQCRKINSNTNRYIKRKHER